MISIASAMQQDAIKELLEGYNEDGVYYTFKEKQGNKNQNNQKGQLKQQLKKRKN